MTRTIRGHGGTDGTRWLGREVGARGWRPTAAVTLLVGVLAVAAAASSSVTAGTDEPANLSDLPLAVHARISAVLGRDQSSYHAVPQAGGFRVENSKHGLTADFTPAAVRVRAGTASWGLSLLGYGYSDAPSAATAVAPQAAANRVEYRRGDLTEWYLNGPLGLEQGFTLAKAPGKSTGAPLTLAFKLSGNLIASADATGKDAILSRADGTAALRYRGLTANDATGRELRSWLQVEGERLLLRVDDTGARYPVVVDPFIEQARLTASDGADHDTFGIVAVHGDTIVVGAFLDNVGANTDQGSAYVFVKPIGGWSGPLSEQARLIALDGAAGDQFGISVAMSADTIVVGARGDDVVRAGVTRIDQGSAYVFVKPPGGWSGTPNQSAHLTASAGAASDQFGGAVAISGDTIVVGARLYDRPFCSPPCLESGRAYVFVKPTAGWSNRTENATLNPTLGAGDQFGNSVAIDEETIVVGAWLDGPFDRGRAYVFVKPVAGWSGDRFSNVVLSPSGLEERVLFGVSVGVSGDTIVVGAYLDNIGANTDQGSAYVFVKPPGGWGSGTPPQSAVLTASDGAAFDQFGERVAISGDTVFVAAIRDDIGLNTDQGSVYTFVKPSTGWNGPLTESEKLTASDGAAFDAFGILGVSGNTLVVGALGDDVGAHINQGSAYVFVGDSVPATVALTPESAENPVGTTHTVTATVEDVNAQPVANAMVRFAVTGSVTESGSCTTDENGQCEFMYEGPTAPGEDVIAAFADTDRDGVQDLDEAGDTATKTWAPGPPATVTVTPAADTNPVGTTHAVAAFVTDAFANPVPGVDVRFAVTGSVSASGQCATDANGQCSFAYQGPTSPGSDTITAFADTDGDSVQDPDEPGGTATKTWVPGAPASVVLTPAFATNPVSTEHCVTATVTDTFGNPVSGVTVRFNVMGAVTTSGSVATNAGGQAEFCYLGPDLPGADDITAHADTNDNGTVDEGEPVGGATKAWLMPDATPGHVTGGGQAPAQSGGDAIAFGFSAKSTDTGIKGNCNVVDGAADVHVKCVDVTSLTRSGTHATIFGTATINGTATGFRIDVDDLGEPGAWQDTFRIVTSSGYSAGGILTGGNIQVR